MSIPASLTHLIDQASKAIAQHPHHDLAIGYRYCLYQAMGISQDTLRLPVALGHRRRIRLALTSLYAVLPLWEAHNPTDARPHRLLAAVECALTDTPIVWEHIRADVFDPFDADALVDAIGVGATWLFRLVQTDFHLTAMPVDVRIEDTFFNVYDRDVAYFAAIAWSNGPWWVSGSSATHRHIFWQWWLTYAVPQAYAAYYRQGW